LRIVEYRLQKIHEQILIGVEHQLIFS